MKILGASVVLLSAAACGTPTVPAGPAPASSSPAPVTSTAPPTSTPVSPPGPAGPPKTRPTQGVPPGDTAPAADQVDASALPAGYPHDVVLAQGGKVVLIRANEAGCDHLSAAAGDQTAQRVVVKITVTHTQSGRMCPMHVREVALPVPLTQPLGGRTLVLQPGP